MPKPFLYKVIRCDEEGNSRRDWRHMLMAMTKSRETVTLKHRNPRTPRVKQSWGIRVNGVYRVGVDKLFPKQQKQWYSKHTSFSYADPTQNYLPPAFGRHDAGRAQQLIGIMFPVVEKNILIQRITQYDRSTYERSYLYPSKRAAVEAYKKRLQDKVEFTNLDDLAKAKVVDKHNEVMARTRWDKDCSLLIFSDNLAMRLLTQIRAINVSNRLIQRCKEDGVIVPPGKKPKVAIHFYADDPSKLAEYDTLAQEKDLKEAYGSSDLTVKRYAIFHSLLSKKFQVTAEELGSYSFDDLKEFITLASNLTFETSVLFYKNFFLTQYQAIIKKLEENKQGSLLQDLFMCVPPELRHELIVKRITDPQHRAHYLFSLMQRENFELDDKEIIYLLNSDWDFDIDLRNDAGKSLRQVAMENSVYAAIKPLITIKCRKYRYSIEAEYRVLHEMFLTEMHTKTFSQNAESIKAFLAFDPSFLFKHHYNGGTLLQFAVNTYEPGLVKILFEYAGQRAEELKKFKNNKGNDYYSFIVSAISAKMGVSDSLLYFPYNFDHIEALTDMEENLPAFLQWEDTTEKNQISMRLVTVIYALKQNNIEEFSGLMDALRNFTYVKKEIITDEIYKYIMNVLNILKINGIKCSPQLLTQLLKENDHLSTLKFSIIIRATECNDLVTVRKLLETNPEIPRNDADGNSLLDYATAWGATSIVDYLQQDVSKALQPSQANVAGLMQKIVSSPFNIDLATPVNYIISYAAINQLKLTLPNPKNQLLYKILPLLQLHIQDYAKNENILDTLYFTNEYRITLFYEFLNATQEKLSEDFINSVFTYAKDLGMSKKTMYFNLLVKAITRGDEIVVKEIEHILKIEPSCTLIIGGANRESALLLATYSGRIDLVRIIENAILTSGGTQADILRIKKTCNRSGHNYYSRLALYVNLNQLHKDQKTRDTINQWFEHEPKLPEFLGKQRTYAIERSTCITLFCLSKAFPDYFDRYNALTREKQIFIKTIIDKLDGLATKEFCAWLFTLSDEQLLNLSEKSSRIIKVSYLTYEHNHLSYGYPENDSRSKILEFAYDHKINISRKNLDYIKSITSHQKASFILALHNQLWQCVPVTTKRFNAFFARLHDIDQKLIATSKSNSALLPRLKLTASSDEDRSTIQFDTSRNQHFSIIPKNVLQQLSQILPANLHRDMVTLLTSSCLTLENILSKDPKDGSCELQMLSAQSNIQTQALGLRQYPPATQHVSAEMMTGEHLVLKKLVKSLAAYCVSVLEQEAKPVGTSLPMRPALTSSPLSSVFSSPEQHSSQQTVPSLTFFSSSSSSSSSAIAPVSVLTQAAVPAETPQNNTVPSTFKMEN